MDLHWWSVEVFDAPGGSARAWRDAWGAALTEAAITNGAYDWEWHVHSWGVLFEIAFADGDRWHAYRDLPAVRAALDAVPDPVNGLMIYPGRGGSAGRDQPRRPRPVAGAGAASLPEPTETLRAVSAVAEPPAEPVSVVG